MPDTLFDIPALVIPDPIPVLHVAPTQAPLDLVFAVNVHGTPGPQGSKKGFYNKALGRVQMVESSNKVKPWRDSVRLDAHVERTRTGLAPLDRPVLVDMVFTFTRPRAHYRTGRNAHLLRDAAPLRPAGYPDLDKLARSTGDALTSAGVLKDDGRIAEYHRLAKVWANEDPDALDSPGVVIRIYTIGAAQ